MKNILKYIFKDAIILVIVYIILANLKEHLFFGNAHASAWLITFGIMSGVVLIPVATISCVNDIINANNQRSIDDAIYLEKYKAMEDIISDIIKVRKNVSKMKTNFLQVKDTFYGVFVFTVDKDNNEVAMRMKANLDMHFDNVQYLHNILYLLDIKDINFNNKANQLINQLLNYSSLINNCSKNVLNGYAQKKSKDIVEQSEEGYKITKDNLKKDGTFGQIAAELKRLKKLNR
ncbi:hypothetical protein FD06_GL000454 [Apilactobacillus ozensis DSM 23829 = JCM 17196]|uniref:Uncharacterized protein n=1 Tax=Apilactobacillus ozensis DSM 23829 = JCM 17196 TaxID=1423781 RepID=A0A0R2ALG8_9LACO|nr:hypothetical protein [Apilactobacillus ozensis]KRM67735.1 hypothetical protein FD06_GL000454 [Apilactobacillus ozensis DSM 23829 = JCM 17196]